MKIEGQIAVVTGGGSGLGEAVARELARLGARVAVLDVNAGGAAKVAAQIGGISAVCDITDTASLTAALDAAEAAHGAARIVMNIAGIGSAKRVIGKDGAPAPLDDFERVVRVNLIGTFTVTQKAAPILGSGGRIVNMSSVSGQMGLFGQANYSSSKAAIIALTKVSAREFARQNITVNAIAPGFIDVGMSKGMPDEVTEKFIKQIPLGRLGRVDEIVEAALFLCSPLSSYITGQVLNVNGGFYMG